MFSCNVSLELKQKNINKHYYSFNETTSQKQSHTNMPLKAIHTDNKSSSWIYFGVGLSPMWLEEMMQFPTPPASSPTYYIGL